MAAADFSGGFGRRLNDVVGCGVVRVPRASGYPLCLFPPPASRLRYPHCVDSVSWARARVLFPLVHLISDHIPVHIITTFPM